MPRRVPYFGQRPAAGQRVADERMGTMVDDLTRSAQGIDKLSGISINLAANLGSCPIQFGMLNLPLASVDTLIVLVTTLWMVPAFGSASGRYLQGTYLV